MITINSGKLCIPEKERFIGFAGDNLHSTKQFLVENEISKNCTYRLYLTFDDGTVNYFVLDSKVENGSTILTWDILEEHIFKSGIVNAQIKSIAENGEAYHTSWDYFFVDPSAEFSGEFKDNENAEFLRYEKELNEIYKKINNTDLSSFVSGERTIAGLPLSSDITEIDLCDALSIYPITLKDHAPTPQEGVTGSLCIDTTSNDLHYCSDVTLSGYNWIKLSGDTDNQKGLSQAEINKSGELVLSYSDGSTSNLGIVVGKDGINGKDGETPIVTIMEIADGYKIYVETEEDTQYAIVKNGIDGKTPIKGVDYFTDEDKADIVQAVIESFGGNPVSGYVDENNNVIVTGNLSNGTYNIKYELEDGTTIDIGELTLTDDDTEKPAYTNLAEPNADNTTDFTIWCNDSRITTTGEVETNSGKSTTNFFEATKGDTVRYRGLTLYRLGLYKPDKTAIVGGSLNSLNTNGYLAEYNETDEEVSFKIHPTVNLDIGYVRLSGTLTGTADDVIITVNEEIV